MSACRSNPTSSSRLDFGSDLSVEPYLDYMEVHTVHAPTAGMTFKSAKENSHATHVRSTTRLLDLGLGYHIGRAGLCTLPQRVTFRVAAS